MEKLITSIVLFLLGSACGQEAQNQTKATSKPRTISVGKGPDALFLTPDENHLYVANVEDTFISVIDTRKDQVVRTIDGTDYPWGFTQLGKTNLVAVSGWVNSLSLRTPWTTSKRPKQNLSN